MQYSKWVTLGFGALCLVLVAGVLRAQHLYYMAAILLTLPGVSYLLGWQALRGLEFEREMPAVAWEGETSHFTYIVRNPTRLARFFLAVHEALPDWIVVEDTDTSLFNVAANDAAQIAHPVCFRRRGVYNSSGYDLTAMDPLGVFAFVQHIPSEGEIVVYPMPQSMRDVDLGGTERFGWQEFTSRVLHGSSVDPDGVRPYVPGDSMRRIHWRQTARTGRLSVIEFEEAQSTNLVIALDLHRGTNIGHGNDTTLEYGVRLAASMAQEAIQHGASVRLLLPPSSADSSGTVLAASLDGRGQEHLFLVLDALARVDADADMSIRECISERMITVRPGTTLLIITSHADPRLSEAIGPYLAADVRVGVVYVDPDSFLEERRRNRKPAELSGQAFVAGLSALQIPTFIVHRTQDGILNPEEISYASTAEPASA